jgi:endoglucanase
MRKYGIFLGFLVLSLQLFSQSIQSNLFKNGDRVCFIGNSITHNGEFHHDIFLYYATRFPKERVYFYNCGISGDVAGGVLARMEDDILIHKPTVSVVMIGMNDVNRGLYTKANEGNPEMDRKKAEALEGYKKNTTKMAETLKQQGSRLILQLPTIYDQTAKIPTENLFGVNDALGKCAEHLKNAAAVYHATVVDYYTILKKLNQQGQRQDSTYTIIGKDRVHPQSPGHLVMAYQFLKTTGAPVYVSRIEIDAAKKIATTQDNCEVRLQTFKNGRIVFNCLENALPYPVKKEALPALDLVPFEEELNQELLQVQGLQPGWYDLLIDHVKVGSWASDQLAKGINLAVDTLTPQYRQSQKVLSLCNEYRAVAGNLRNIAYIDFKYMIDFKGNAGDSAAIKSHLRDKIAATTNAYVRMNLEQYLINKPREAFFKSRLEEIRNEIYKNNQPVSHNFELVKNKTPLAARNGQLYLLAGQSNAVGPGDSLTSLKCSFNTAFEYNATGDDFIPLKDPAGKAWKLFQKAGSGSVAPPFARRLNEITGQPVFMVTAARGGASCHQKAEMGNYNTWDSSGKLFEQAVEKVKLAETRAGISLSGIIWMQGERDANAILAGQMTGAEYQLALESLILRFREKFGKKLPFYIVQTAYQQDKAPDGCDAVRNAQMAVTQKMKGVYLAYGETGEFAKRKWFKDIVHYNQIALNDIGTKVAEFVMSKQGK